MLTFYAHSASTKYQGYTWQTWVGLPFKYIVQVLSIPGLHTTEKLWWCAYLSCINASTNNTRATQIIDKTTCQNTTVRSKFSKYYLPHKGSGRSWFLKTDKKNTETVRMIPNKRHKSKYPAVQHQLADSATLWFFFFQSFIWSSGYTHMKNEKRD